MIRKRPLPHVTTATGPAPGFGSDLAIAFLLLAALVLLLAPGARSEPQDKPQAPTVTCCKGDVQ